MARRGKKYQQADKEVKPRPYTLEEAISLVRKIKPSAFDETMEIAFLLGVDPKHADQMVRGTVVLPHGTGRTKRILVIATGEKVAEAEKAGADFTGGSEMVQKIRDGWLDFDAVVATPDMMKEVGKLGKILGPKGLMPNPKVGTVTFEVAGAVREIKAGKVEFRVDKTAIVHSVFGKTSFEEQQLLENARVLVGAILKAKPPAAKGRYLRSVHISSTMGPGVQLDTTSLETSVS
jgi:large subunit ribosomal protein L1